MKINLKSVGAAVAAAAVLFSVSSPAYSADR